MESNKTNFVSIVIEFFELFFAFQIVVEAKNFLVEFFEYFLPFRINQITNYRIERISNENCNFLVYL